MFIITKLTNLIGEPQMDSLKEVLLTSIDKTLDSQEFYNGLDNSNWKDWDELQKFEWAFKLYKATVGRYESEPYKSVEYWLSGLALNVPFESWKIQQMGFNSETWFKDLADELQIQVGVKPRTLEGRFIPNFHD